VVFIRRVSGSGTNAYWSGNELLQATSSIRFKTDIQDYAPEISGTDRYEKLRPVLFRWKEGHDNLMFPGELHPGLIAEKVEELFPEFVVYEFESPGDASTPMVVHALNYDLMTSLNVCVAKKAIAELDRMEAELDRLEQIISARGSITQ
jgi:hypothetical protein